MRWSFWLFVLAEFCRRCETKGTRRGVFSGVPSGIQEQSSWGGQGKPHEAVGFLALGWNWFHWLSENVTRCATRTSVFAGTTLRGDTPIFSHRFCANLMSGPGGQWGVQTPRGLATRHVIMHQSAKFYPNRTTFSRKRMTSCRFSRWRISAILDSSGPIMGSLKSPCTTSYMP